MWIRWGAPCALLIACAAEEAPDRPADPAESGTLGPDTAEDPDALAVQITPPTPRAGMDSLYCAAPDDAALSWWHEGSLTSHVGPELHPHDVAPGTWRCDATLRGKTGSSEVVASPIGGNLLVVLLDDIGLDKVGVYGMHPKPAPTPVLDRLASDGVRFTNAYAMPICSPTRAALLSGQLPRRTGVGHLVEPGQPTRWLVDTDTVPDVLARSPLGPYTSAVTGKWHLARLADTHHPADLGFSVYAGAMANPNMAANPGQTQGYSYWEKNTQGELAFTDVYMTTDTTNDAIAQIASLPEPWFLYVPYNSAHEPWHRPPQELHTRTVLQRDVDRMDAMIEAVDTELGRLLSAMTDEQRARTTIVVLGDNGTQADVVRPPSDPSRGKGTLHEGGVRVPMIVASPHVHSPGSVSDAMVHVVDVLPTAAALAGVGLDDAEPRDGISLLPLLAEPDVAWPRSFLYAEKFLPNGFGPPDHLWATVRDSTHKLVLDRTGEVSFHALIPGQVDEGPDLLGTALDDSEQEAYDRLSAEMASIQAALSAGGPIR